VVDNLIKLVNIIYQTPLLNANELAKAIDVSIPTINRYLRILRTLIISELQGARKTGGYRITENFRKYLDQ